VNALKDGYASVLLFLKLVDDIEKGEIALQASNLFTRLQNFQFLVILFMLHKIFAHTAILNGALQHNKSHIARALELAAVCSLNLIGMKSDDSFERIYEEAIAFATENDITPPTSSDHSVRRPKRLRPDGDNIMVESEPKKRFKETFYEVIDSLADQIALRFNISNYKHIVIIYDIFTEEIQKLERAQHKAKLEIFKSLLNFDSLFIELCSWRGMKAKHKLKSFLECVSFFSNSKLQEIFPNLTFSFLSIWLYLFLAQKLNALFLY